MSYLRATEPTLAKSEEMSCHKMLSAHLLEVKKPQNFKECCLQHTVHGAEKGKQVCVPASNMSVYISNIKEVQF